VPADPIEKLLFPAPTSERAEQHPVAIEAAPGETVRLAGVEDDELVLSAKRKLTLRCGKSSITLYPNGKIVLRGDYILSDAEETNRINGGRIELN
jgi:hypothetical protein